MNKINIAIKLVIRNEEQFLHEWFQYYIALGFKNFIIYDDESTDDTKNIIDIYSNIINIHYNLINTSIKKHYEDIFNYKQYDYIFFFDIDEFLYINPKINIINFLIKNLKNKNSVIQIPLIEAGNKENYIKNINDLECLKYDYLDEKSLIGNAILNDKENNNFQTYSTKHIFNPKYSSYISGHTSKPNNGYNIVSEFNNLEFLGKWFFKDIIKNIFNYNIILFHFDTKNDIISKNKLKYHRNICIHINRKNNNIITKKLNRLKIQNNIHINYSKNLLKNFFYEYGYYIVKNFFNKNIINNILYEAQDIYKTQMIKLNIINYKDISNEKFEKSMKILFDKYFQIFINCGKQCQHLISLWKLSLDEKLIKYLKFLGIKKPNISTRPVLFSNSKHIAKNKINHTVPPHQDWASMQGSINSIVVWIPLIDINKDLGSIEIIPKSHKEGLLSTEKEGSFGLVENYKETDFISFDVKQGDIILFNSFLVHKSGNNITDNIRWSCHLRYNDLDDNSFIKRGYPHAYIYKPIDEYLTPKFDTKKYINNYLIKSKEFDI
jgi:phytanoyl-CoA hydroxylase